MRIRHFHIEKIHPIKNAIYVFIDYFLVSSNHIRLY